MFLEEEKKNNIKAQKEVFGQRSEIQDPNSNIFILLGGIIILILSFALIYLLFFQKPVAKQNNNKSNPISSSSSGKLPDDTGPENVNEYDFGSSTEKITAENINFGYFYEKPKPYQNPTLITYELPINIKTDVKNYYDASRKISLDKYLDDLNNNGFAILEEQKDILNSDFFTTYQDLYSKNLPFVITNDFIVYFYQNTLKDVYKEIEKNVFYEHVWRLNKSMYDIALTRYKKTEVELGVENNPVLEGQRLELAYFTMALKLLMPTENQILPDGNFSDPNKFNAQEADKFSFVVPDFLKNDIEREYKLITGAISSEKSPIMLYPVDYKKFSVPANYHVDAKLNNFYLVLEWLKNVFPIYYKDIECEDCLLDKDDWTINLYAAARIAKDLNENQDLKNQWAIIYKFISFFSGLRQEITYLDYHRALEANFGDAYDLEMIFSLNNQKRTEDLEKIQNSISNLRFSPIEGAIDRNNKSLRRDIGMRILQQSYWPNDYVFRELSGESIKANFDKITENTKKTACSSKSGGIYRCNGIGYDIINLVQPIKNGGQYFLENTDYKGYDERINSLRQEMSYFNQNTWNNNIYWLSLDILKTLLESNPQNFPAYAKNDRWQQEKNYQTALGSWVNLHLAEDTISLYAEKETNTQGLGLYNRGCDLNNYIELNSDLLEEMIARNVMLLKMLSILKVDKDTNAASLELKDLNSKLQQLLVVSKKILNNQVINDDDCRVLDDFARRNMIEKKAKKSFTIKSMDKISTQRIDDVKLLALVYIKNGEKILAFGPMFNYKE